LKHLTAKLRERVDLSALQDDRTIVTNTRHIEALKGAQRSLEDVLHGFENQVPGDLVAIDIRKALYHLGEITGHVSPDDLLGNIFSRFCIGK
jgi:tRNA modification GTPase